MADGWRDLPLGTFLTQRRDIVAPVAGQTYMQLTLSMNGRGVRLRREVDGSHALASSQFRVRAADLLVSKIDARKGAAAVVPDEFDGAIVTADFPTFVIDTSVTYPPYLDLVVRSPSFAALADTISAGTTNRVRMDLARFPDLVVTLPPLAAQRRIVDLIGAVDDAVHAADSLVGATEHALSAYLDAVFMEPAMTTTMYMGDIASMGSGPSWSAADETDAPRSGSMPVVGITCTPANTRLVDVTQRRYVTGLPSTVRTLTSSSLVLIRTNGNRSRIGNAYRVPDSAVGHAFSAFQIGVSVHDPQHTAYLFWFLTAPTTQARISEAASGSTGLGNIAVRWLNRLQVPWPADKEQARITAMADSIDAASVAAREVRSRAQALRNALLADLLSGEHGLPASYDRFLGDAA